jgi:hypothetical protein
MPIMDYGLPAPELAQGNGRFWGAIDKLAQTWPAKMARAAYDAVRLPGQVAGGIMNVPPAQPGIMWSDMDEARQQATQATMMNRAADLGGLVMGGGYPMAQTGALGMAGGKLPRSFWRGENPGDTRRIKTGPKIGTVICLWLTTRMLPSSTAVS